MAKLVSLDKYLGQYPISKWDYNKGDTDNFLAQNEWLANICKAIRQDNPSSGISGEVVRWPRADGYACYFVVNDKPLRLAHIPLWDAWQVEDALIRGLTLKDVKKMVAYEKKVKEYFESIS